MDVGARVIRQPRDAVAPESGPCPISADLSLPRARHRERSTVHVCHVLDHSLPVRDGYAFRSHAILACQRRRGWVASAVTSPKHHESWQGPWSAEERVGDVRYFRSGPSRRHGLPVLDEVRLMARLARRLLGVARRARPAILHAHSPVLNGIPALAVGWATRTPVVYEVRALWEDGAVDHGTYRQGSWRYRLTRALETWVCRRASHVIVLCDGLRADLGARGVPPDRMTVVPNGVDLDAFQPCPPDEAFRRQWDLGGKRVLGFMGSFFHYEGLDLLITAMARLASVRPDVTLLLVGEGRTEPQLREQVARLGLESRVVLAGAVSHDRLRGIYPLADVLVYPRHSMRLTELVTPLKPLEAMAMGKPVVASDVGGHRELVKHGQTGLLFRAGDARALTETLITLLDAPVLRADLGRGGQEWVRRERSWTTTTSPYAKIYRTLAQNPRDRCR